MATCVRLCDMNIMGHVGKSMKRAISEIRCECDCQHHHKGGYWTCGIKFIRILGKKIA